MKFNFKKILSVATSAVMLGSTVAAAAYPAPFVQDGTANGAVVVGANAAVSDLYAAVDLSQALNDLVTASEDVSGGTTVVGGDFVKLERDTDKFNLNDAMSDFYTTIDEDELSVVLGEGVYQNDANDEFDFEQRIVLASDLNMTHFVDDELDENEVPQIGFDLSSGKKILNYTLEFTPNAAEAGGAWTAGNDLETTDLTMLGRTYYLLSARNSSATDHELTLLDTANSAVISEGETSTISVGDDTYDVSIVYIDSNEVILDVNGVETNKLGEGGVFKVEENLYIAVKSNLYSEKESGVSKVDVSLGSGKIVMKNGVEVKINNEDVSENTDSVLNAYISTSSNNLNSITLEWILDDDAWIVPGTDLVLPGFETIKFSMGGFNIPSEETTKLKANGDDSITLSTVVKDGDVSLDILYLNSTNTGIAGLGEKASHKLVTNLTATPHVNLNESENSYFVATWYSGDDSESYAFEIGSITDNSGKNSTDLKNLADGGSDISFSEVGKDKDVGQLRLTLLAASDSARVATIKVAAASSGTVVADRIISKDGLMMKLPVNSVLGGDGLINLTAGEPTSWAMNFTEEDIDGNLMKGPSFKVTLAVDGTDGLEPTTISGITVRETEDDSDVYEGYVISALATKVLQDKPSNGLNTLDIMYHGTEAFADVFISETGAAVEGSALAGGAAGAGGKVTVVKDSEVSSVSSKNLLVVGGSCINSVAAKILDSDSPVCGADFSALTNVADGQFLIKTVKSPYSEDAVATLVAGYEAGDTTDAVAKLKEGAVTDADTEQVYPIASSE